MYLIHSGLLLFLFQSFLLISINSSSVDVVLSRNINTGNDIKRFKRSSITVADAADKNQLEKATDGFGEGELPVEAMNERKKREVLNAVAYKDKVKSLSDGAVTTEWLDQILSSHNLLRERHTVDPLIIDYKLCYDAQLRVNEVTENNAGKSKVDFGEFIPGDNEFSYQAIKSSGTAETLLKLDGGLAGAAWYDEIKDHDWEKNEFSSETQQAIQMIWAKTERIGCGRSVTENKEDKPFLIVICRYDPVGNDKDKGAFTDNVASVLLSAEPEYFKR